MAYVAQLPLAKPRAIGMLVCFSSVTAISQKMRNTWEVEGRRVWLQKGSEIKQHGGHEGDVHQAPSDSAERLVEDACAERWGWLCCTIW